MLDHAYRGRPGLIPPPVDDIHAYATTAELALVDHACAVVGSPETVRRGISDFIAKHQPDELMLTANIFDHAARMRSFELAADVLGIGR